MIQASHNKQQLATIDTLAYSTDPRGVQRIVIRNQNIAAWHIPRQDLSWVKDNIKDASRPGIYFLVNDTMGIDGHVPIYVGLARSGVNRVLQHNLDDKKLFTHVVLITGLNDDIFDDASIAYLERLFIDDVFTTANKGYRIEPLNQVQPKGVHVRNEDQHVYDEYASVIKWYMAYLGYDYSSDALYAGAVSTASVMPVIDPAVSDVSGDNIILRNIDDFEYGNPLDDAYILTHGPLLTLHRKGARNVRGVYNQEIGAFHVLSGSEIKQTCMKSATKQTKALRDTLIDHGFMSYVGDSHLVFDVDVTFKSLKIATAVVAGGNVSDDIWRQNDAVLSSD